GEKIQIIFRASPVGVLPGNQTDDGYTAAILGDARGNHLANSILYTKDIPVGILRTKEETDWYIELFEEYNEKRIDILTIKNEQICKGEKLYGCDISSSLSLFFANLITKELQNSDKCIDFTVWNSSSSGENGIVSALQYANADKIIYLSLKNVENGVSAKQGPALVLKDGNYVLDLDAKKRFFGFVSSQEIELQSFVGKTDRILEILDVHAMGHSVLGIYLPVEYEKTKMKEVLFSNVEKTRNLLLKYIQSL
ncbi:MAG: hypothetical protein J6A56_04000, partial [Clostridia bacterium]|nr:hypothetical protein [Clostridia bacterium]